MVQMIQCLHMQGGPFHFLSNVLNSEIFSVVFLIPLLIELHNLGPSYIKHFLPRVFVLYFGSVIEGSR